MTDLFIIKTKDSLGYNAFLMRIGWGVEWCGESRIKEDAKRFKSKKEARDYVESKLRSIPKGWMLVKLNRK